MKNIISLPTAAGHLKRLDKIRGADGTIISIMDIMDCGDQIIIFTDIGRAFCVNANSTANVINSGPMPFSDLGGPLDPPLKFKDMPE